MYISFGLQMRLKNPVLPLIWKGVEQDHAAHSHMNMSHVPILDLCKGLLKKHLKCSPDRQCN